MLGTADLDLLETMMEPLSDSPFFVKNSRFRYVAANSAMARLCGVERAGDLLGRRAEAFFSSAQSADFESLDASVLATGLGFRDNFVRGGAAGRNQVWLLFARTPIADADGRTVGVVGTARQFPETKATAGILRRLSRAVEIIRARYPEPIEAMRLAEAVGVSDSQINRSFLKIFGMSPRALQQRIRLEKAVQLLRGDETIGAIAYLCGYADQSAFTRRMRQLTGRTPSELRAALIPQER